MPLEGHVSVCWPPVHTFARVHAEKQTQHKGLFEWPHLRLSGSFSGPQCPFFGKGVHFYGLKEAKQTRPKCEVILEQSTSFGSVFLTCICF